jgi:regulatory protein
VRGEQLQPGDDEVAAGPGAGQDDALAVGPDAGGDDALAAGPGAGGDGVAGGSGDLAPGELAAARPFGAGDELERQKAFDVAWRFLAHRDRTEAEVRQNFVKKRVDPVYVEDVVAALLEGHYIDDAVFARRFAEDRRNLDGWGADRIERRLNELGVDRQLISAAVGEGEHDELAAACELLARRFPAPPQTPRDRDRALGFLVRKGYDLELAYDALRRHANASVEY